MSSEGVRSFCKKGRATRLVASGSAVGFFHNLGLPLSKFLFLVLFFFRRFFMANTDYVDVCTRLSSQYEQINGYDFYRDVFPNNENKGEFNTDFSKPNAIFLYQDENTKQMKRRVMLNDSWEADYMDYIECNPMTLCSGLSYRGRANKLENAQQMNALIFDLDAVGANELDNILYLTTLSSDKIRAIPMPTYMVASGTGLHLYYVFDTPIDLFPNIKVQLKSLKYDLTYRFWNPTVTSKEKQIQYQSINQGFRMVGSINGKYGTEVIAYKTGKRWTLSDLNAYADSAENQVDINKPFRPTKITKDQAKEMYPEWYQRVVIDGNKSIKKWDIKSKQGYALYEWWRSHVRQVKGGHRYFYLMCMAIYACKCDVPFDKLKEDMRADFSIISQTRHSNPLTDDDMKSALEMYSREYYNFKIDDIEKLTDIRIERNKRNGRKQEQHLQLARGIRQLKESMGEVVSGGGRPDKAKIVQEWRKNNPNGKKIECERETGLSRHTVLKWWETKAIKRKDHIPKGHWVPQNVIRTRSDSNEITVTIQLPQSDIDKINNMSLDELKLFVEIQEDDNVLGYAYMRLMQLKSKG